VPENVDFPAFFVSGMTAETTVQMIRQGIEQAAFRSL
jgi:hypothetical protein